MKIEFLNIYTSKLEEQLKFFRDLFGLKIQNYTEESFEVLIGTSILKLSKKANATPYHLAFHIPDKQEEIALEWVKERVALIKSYNNEIVDFSNWDAKSLYFYDIDENILEFISRRTLNSPKSAFFSEESILGIAEIGLATSNIRKSYEFLSKNFQLEKFDGNFEKFCAIGDPDGLIITINKYLKDWFPDNDKAYASGFSLIFSHQNNTHHLQFKNDELHYI